MTKKLFEDNIMEENMEQLPAVKQMVRWLGGSTEGAVDSVQEVDIELTEWINKGYRLFATHYVGTDSGAYGVLYVLVLNV